MTDLECMLRISMAEGVGAVTYRSLMEHFGEPEAILRASPQELQQCPEVGAKTAASLRRAATEIDVDREIALAEKCGVQIVPFGSEQYPRNLAMIYDPPIVLYVMGKLVEQDAMAIAVVGSRRGSYYGQRQAQRLSSDLAAMGFTIVSGLARGVDAAAHRGALGANGRTVAVLGSGLANVYPRENRELADLVSRRGAVVSELPLRTPPDAGNFPPRNRIISGLCLGVVVIEAALRSGSLITAKWALEQGREVFAVPGPIDSPYSRGPHQLIKDGAKLVESARDVVEELGPLSEVVETEDGEVVEDARTLALNVQEAAIFNVLSPSPKAIDQITRDANVDPAAAASTLMILEVKGLVKQLSGKRFVKA